MYALTYSPALTLAFVFGLLCITMDIDLRALHPVKRWLVLLGVAALAAFNHVLRSVLGAAEYGRLISLTMHLPFFLLFLWLSKDSPVKVIFMILTAMIFCVPAVFLNHLAQAQLSHARWVLFLADFLGYALTLLLAQLVFRKSFHFLLKFGSDQLFSLLLLVPLSYYFYVFAGMRAELPAPVGMSGILVRCTPSALVLLFYFLILYIYKSLSERQLLLSEQSMLCQQLDAAGQELALMHEAQLQTAVYRHDMRHHLSMLQELLRAKNYEQAEAYIREVEADICAVTPQRFCENETVNLLCSAFSARAARAGAQLEVRAALPAALSISETELCSVLSNGLENALHAVGQLEEKSRIIRLYCALRQNKLLIEIENPYTGEVHMQNGIPETSVPGHGYGCRSIQSIAQKNSGLCEFRAENGVFLLRLILSCPPL